MKTSAPLGPENTLDTQGFEPWAFCIRSIPRERQQRVQKQLVYDAEAFRLDSVKAETWPLVTIKEIPVGLSRWAQVRILCIVNGHPTPQPVRRRGCGRGLLVGHFAERCGAFRPQECSPMAVTCGAAGPEPKAFREKMGLPDVGAPVREGWEELLPDEEVDDTAATQ